MNEEQNTYTSGRDIDHRLACWYKNGCVLYRKDCHKTCHRYLEMNYLICNCGITNASKYIKPIVPEKEDKKAFDTLAQIKQDVVSFVNSGNTLYIVSSHLKNGKTTWALKIMYKFFDEIWAGNGFRVRGFFLHVPEFLTKLKTFSYKETVEYKNLVYVLNNADLVVWDDISSMTLTNNEQNVINTFLSRRSQNDKANIFTGYNLGDALVEQVGVLMSKRITDGYVVEIKSPGRTNEMNEAKVKAVMQKQLNKKQE